MKNDLRKPNPIKITVPMDRVFLSASETTFDVWLHVDDIPTKDVFKLARWSARVSFIRAAEREGK